MRSDPSNMATGESRQGRMSIMPIQSHFPSKITPTDDSVFAERERPVIAEIAGSLLGLQEFFVLMNLAVIYVGVFGAQIEDNPDFNFVLATLTQAQRFPRPTHMLSEGKIDFHVDMSNAVIISSGGRLSLPTPLRHPATVMSVTFDAPVPSVPPRPVHYLAIKRT
jgi:hypothetical protein